MKFNLLLPLMLLIAYKVPSNWASLHPIVSARNFTLNADVVRLIIDELELHEMNNVAAASSVLNSIAKDSFRQNFKDFRIEIWKDEDRYEDKFQIDYVKKTVQIFDYKMALNTLKHYGNEIHRLFIVNRNLRGYRARQINRFANLYGSESITELDLFLYLAENSQAVYNSIQKCRSANICRHLYLSSRARHVTI